MTNLILAESVIIWYEKNSRKLPWRPLKGDKPNPFHVLLSEFMLQQTVVKTVIPYFNKFILKYPCLLLILLFVCPLVVTVRLHLVYHEILFVLFLFFSPKLFKLVEHCGSLSNIEL